MTNSTLYSACYFPYSSQCVSDSPQLLAMDQIASSYNLQKSEYIEDFPNKDQVQDIHQPVLSFWQTSPYEVPTSPDSLLYGEVNIKVEEDEFLLSKSSPHYEYEQIHHLPSRGNSEGFYIKREIFPDICDSSESPKPQYPLESSQHIGSPVQFAYFSSLTTDSELMAYMNSSEEFLLSSVVEPGLPSLVDTNRYDEEKFSTTNDVSSLMEYPSNYGNDDDLYSANFLESSCLDSCISQQMRLYYIKQASYGQSQTYSPKLNGGYSRKKRSSPLNSMISTFSSRTTSSSGKKYHCAICHKGFSRPSSLNTHMYSHTGEKPFKCPYEGCGRHFSVVSNLRRHAKIHNCKPN